MKRWMAAAAVVILSLGLFALQGILMSREGFAKLQEIKEDGWWVIGEEERVPRQDVTAFLVADGELYLFYEQYGLVNAYTVDGGFLRSYQVEVLSNGVGGIGWQDGVLYIDGRGGIYGFRGTELVVADVGGSCADYKRINGIVQEPDNTAEGGYTYHYNPESGQIRRAMPGQALETVVQLPVRDSNVEALGWANMCLWVVFAFWFERRTGLFRI